MAILCLSVRRFCFVTITLTLLYTPVTMAESSNTDPVLLAEVVLPTMQVTGSQAEGFINTA